MNAMTHISSAGGVPAVIINNVPLPPIEVNGERVITLGMIDEVHERTSGTARKRFNDHRRRMKEGLHYFVRKTDEAAALGIKAPNGLILLAERGYLMLVKSLNDDLAWEVQDKLVESYFVKPANRNQQAGIKASRENRLAMSHNLKWAKMAGLVGNQALIAANRATAEMTGIDNLKLLGVTHMVAPDSEHLITPTDIAKRAGLASAQKANHVLCFMGLQRVQRDAKGVLQYEPTEAGLKAGAVMLDTGKRRSSGTPVRQLRWASSVADLVAARTQPRRDLQSRQNVAIESKGKSA